MWSKLHLYWTGMNGSGNTGRTHDVRTQLCGGDERGKLKMTEMSKPAEMLYRAFLDELRFAKQQQWTITNYALLLMGAAYGVAKLTTENSPPSARIAPATRTYLKIV